MKKILIPTDFSSCASKAVDYGLEIAKRVQSDVHFLHVVSTPIEWVDLPLEKEKLFPETKAQIGKAKNELNILVNKAEKMGLKAACSLVFNQGIDDIGRHVKNVKYDLVVMGTHGKKELISLVGSNTLQLIRNSGLPILVVKKDSNFTELKKIVITSDFKPEAKSSFKKTIELAITLGLEIDLLYINTPYHFIDTDEIEHLMEDLLKDYAHVSINRKVINARHEEKGLQLYVQKYSPDMIAVITHGRAGIMSILNPSLAESVINNFSVPVLCINMNVLHESLSRQLGPYHEPV